MPQLDAEIERRRRQADKEGRRGKTKGDEDATGLSTWTRRGRTKRDDREGNDGGGESGRLGGGC